MAQALAASVVSHRSGTARDDLDAVAVAVAVAQPSKAGELGHVGELSVDRHGVCRAVEEHARIPDTLRRREGALLREMLRARHLSGWDAARRALALQEKTGVGEEP